MTFGGWLPDEVRDFALLKREAGLLSSVSMCGFGIQRDGSLHDTIPPEQVAFMGLARAHGIVVWALIGGDRHGLPA
jgi:hypothetical protein